jgi:hypothetical protein
MRPISPYRTKPKKEASRHFSRVDECDERASDALRRSMADIVALIDAAEPALKKRCKLRGSAPMSAARYQHVQTDVLSRWDAGHLLVPSKVVR